MNHLELKTEKLPDPNRKKKFRYVADIYIDHKKFDDLLTAYELPLLITRSGKIEKAKKAAGGYYGSETKTLYNELTSYEIKRGGKKVELCRCAFCDNEGCMSIYAIVFERDDKVIWKDFHNPSRFVDNPGAYDKFGPFTFEKRQYEEAVAQLVWPWA